MALARLQLTILTAEALLYLVAGLALVRLASWSIVATALACAALALAARSAYVLTAFATACRAWAPDPRRRALSARETLTLLVGEIAAFTLTHSVLQPGRRLFRPLLPGDYAYPGQTPVLFVHGYCCNELFWLAMRRRLRRDGLVRQYGISLEPVFGDIDDYAEQLQARIVAICNDTGTTRLNLVGHSMGGLVIRAWLRRYGGDRLAHAVTVGTPHAGSVIARRAVGRNARQMQPESCWLKRLAHDQPLPTLPGTAIASWHDELVVPSISAAPRELPVRDVNGVGHLALGYSTAVREHLRDVLLRQPRPHS